MLEKVQRLVDKKRQRRLLTPPPPPLLSSSSSSSFETSNSIKREEDEYCYTILKGSIVASPKIYCGSSATCDSRKIHAKVGRYKNPDEHPFFPTDLPEPMLPPLQYPQVLHPSADLININSKIWDVYFKNLLPRLVKKGNDGNCGSSATCDSICLQLESYFRHI